MTCNEAGGAQSRKRCPVPGPQPDFIAASRETRRYKGPGPHQFSQAKLPGNKSYGGFMEKPKVRRGDARKCAALTRRKRQNGGA